MKSILFIVPPYLRFRDYTNPPFNAKSVMKENGRFGSLPTDMPIGILSLSSYIKKFLPVETRLADLNVELNKLQSFNFKSFLDFYHWYFSTRLGNTFDPEVIGISTLFTPSYENMLEIADCCREIYPRALILGGGGIPTNMYKEIFSVCSGFDALCYGEGELPLLDLAQAENKAELLSTHSSWITRDKVLAGHIFQHQFVDDLDEIPFYDYDICEVSEYGANPTISSFATRDKELNNFHVMTSRGCPMKCTFCASHSVHGREMRYFSTGRIKEDFLRLIEAFGAQTLVFQDDHFMASKKRALEIIDIVKELGVKTVFQNGLALYALDRTILEALRSAGVEQLMLPVESGSNRVLRKIMRKSLNTSIISRVIKDCRELGIYTNAAILIGMPGETKQDIEDTRQFLKSIDTNWYIIVVASPLPGSEMLETCIDKNYLKSDYIFTDFRHAIIETEDFTTEYIKNVSYEMNLDLNFVNNSDIRLGEYVTALKGFKNAINAKPDHAIAHYYAALCYESLGETARATEMRSEAKRIVDADMAWRRYFEMFNLPLQ